MWRITFFDYRPLSCSETRELRVYTTIFNFDLCQYASIAKGSYTGCNWGEFADTWMRTLPPSEYKDAVCVIQCWFFERNNPKSTERRLIEKSIRDIAIVVDYFEHYSLFYEIENKDFLP